MEASDATRRVEGGSESIDARSRDFLIETFTDLRDDLADRMRKGGQGGPDSEKAGRELAIYEALLAGLAQRETFPDDEAVRQYVGGLATATDAENQYEQAALEHRAFAELVAALAAAESSPATGGSASSPR